MNEVGEIKKEKKFKERFFRKYNYFENSIEEFKIIFRNHSIEKFILISFVFFVLHKCEGIFNDFIFNHYPDWLDQIFSIFQSSKCLNWTTFFVFSLCIITIIYRTIKKPTRISSFFFIFLTFILFSNNDREVWEYLKLPFSDNYDYKNILDIFLSSFLIVKFIIFIYPSILLPIRLIVHPLKPTLTNIIKIRKILNYIKSIKTKIGNKFNTTKKDNDSDASGFIQNTKKGNLRNVGWEKYAKTITDKIIELTKNDIEESFAIGISGPWGSGKTTFIEHIKYNLHIHSKKIIEFDFKPWASVDSNQIRKKFFNSLINIFKPNDNNLAKKILKYADIINDMDKSSWIAKVVMMIKGSNRYSISEIRKEIEERITDKNKIIIFIDDLDRLGSDELYEVIKLIRITANFKNIIYVVAYDPIYVDKLLAKRDIEEGAAFLKKIINVEVSLPAYEKLHIAHLLYNEIAQLIKLPEHLKLIKEAILFKENDQYITASHISGFRDVKRFANIFSLNFTYIYNNNSLNNINIHDFYLIELLHYSYPKTYNALYNTHSLLLYYEYSDNTYTLRSEFTNSKEEIRQKAIDEIKLAADDFSEKTLKLLNLMFRKKTRTEFNSIRYKDDFLIYFCYRNLDDKLSAEEFDKVINANDVSQIEGIVNDWSEKEEYIRIGPSIINRFRTFNTKILSEEKAMNYLYAIIKLTRYFKSGELNKLILSSIKNDKYNKTFLKNLSEFTKKEIISEICNNDNPLTWPIIFKAIYNQTTYWTTPDYMLSENDIKDMKKECFNYWIEQPEFKSKFIFKNIFEKDSLTNKYLKTSIVSNPINNSHILLGSEYIFEYLKCSNNDEFESYEQELINAKEKNDYLKYSDIIMELFINIPTYINFIFDCTNGTVDSEIIKKHNKLVGIDNKLYESIINDK